MEALCDLVVIQVYTFLLCFLNYKIILFFHKIILKDNASGNSMFFKFVKLKLKIMICTVLIADYLFEFFFLFLFFTIFIYLIILNI